MSQPERIFIGWDKPLAAAVAEQILKERVQRKEKHDGGTRTQGVVDLGDQLVIAPSAFAGRMIQEALAAQAGALLLPRIITPSAFLSQSRDPSDEAEANDGDEVAGKEAMLLAWVSVLSLRINRADHPALFPSKQAGPMNPDGAQALAEDLMRLRDELSASASGMTFAEMSEHVVLKSGDFPISQVERWNDLAELERLYLEHLSELGLSDHNDHRRAVAMSDQLPPGTEAIWLACVTDPQPLLQTALERRMAKTPVRVLIAADEKVDGEAFSEWGVPDAQAWSTPRGSAWPDFADTVHIVRKPEDGLETLTRLVSKFHTDKAKLLNVVGRLAITPCDRETHPALITRALHGMARGEGDKPLIETANPLGRRHRVHGIHHAMAALLDFVEVSSFRNLRRCADIPSVAMRLGLTGIEVKKKDGEDGKLSWYKMQQLLDAVSAALPPQAIDDAIEFAERQPIDGDVEPHVKRRNEDIRACVAVLEVASKAAKGLQTAKWRELGEALLALAQPMTGKETPHDEWNFASDVSQAIEASLDALESGRPEQTGLSQVDVVRLALQSSAGRSFRGDMDRHAVNLPGWMEIPWEPVPHLIIFGLTDDLVPGSRHAHPFLPAALRSALHLPSSARQFANAAYTLELVRRQRSSTGRVDVIVPRLNDKGDGLRPSRLLMLSPDTADDRLLGEVGSDGKLKGARGRLDHLLVETAPPPSEPAWVIPSEHRLNPTLLLPDDSEKAEKRLTKLHNSISATAFKTYLEDPSQYWLKHALGMSESSHGEMELDAAGFGTLAHAAVEAFGRDEKANALSDPDEIQTLLEQKLDEHFDERFGDQPNSTLLLQREMARARLQAFALSQAQLHVDGWRILEVEGQLPEIEIITGFKLRGRYDRLDCRVSGGKTEYRVYDYKTFAEAKKPFSTHLYSKKPFIKGIELGQFEVPQPPDKKGKPVDPKPYRWKDLQLPAYYWALTQGHSEVAKGKLDVGYICLSADVSADPIQMWDNFGDEFFSYAQTCMKHVAEAVARRGDSQAFQPATEPARYPVLEHLSGRAAGDYMDITQLGTAKKA